MYSLNRGYTVPLSASSTAPTSENILAVPDTGGGQDGYDYGPDKRGHKGRARKCLASGEVKDISEMIRFVLSPDSTVTPDIMGKLPGRGVWVSADRDALAKAINTGGFARGFKSKIKVGEDLIEFVESLLARRLLGLITMARKSGHIAIGYDQVKAAAGSGKVAWRIEAREGASDGRGKIRTLSKAVALELGQAVPKVMGCFSGAELAKALGRDTVVHIALPPSKLAKAFGVDAARYSGFKALIPTEWDDFKHETKAVKQVSVSKNEEHERP